MRNEAALAAFELLREAARDQRRGRGGKDRVRRGQPVELRKQRLLDLELLGRILLNEAGAGERVGHARRRAHALRGLFRIPGETVRGQIVQVPRDQRESLLCDARSRIVQGDPMPGAREDHGPGAADQACADDGNIRLL